MAKNENQPFHEREHPWQHNERVRPGEDFLLFDTSRKHTLVRYSDDGFFAGLKSSIRLETGLPGNLVLSGIAAPYTKKRSAVLTPFDREQGYPLDQEDLFAHRRLAKAHKMKRERSGSIQGLLLFAFGAPEDETDHSALVQALLPEDLQARESEPMAQLRRLFLTLRFPGGASFTAQAQLNTQRPFLLFRTFFPSDTGPLPRLGNALSPSQESSTAYRATSGISQEQGLDRSEGFDLLVPFDLAKLQLIRAQFLFLAFAGE
jgi:hypothetical protein